MKLKDLLVFNDITIQCHDNPDADALASGYGLYWFFKKQGKNPRFIYRGRNKLQKSNLLIMEKELNIPIEYAPDYDENPELLITVDCQYGQRNVSTSAAQNIAIIDHHQKTVALPELSEVRSNIGSCSTIVWDMLEEEDMSPDNDILLSTALYYGLYTDTNKLSEVSHPLDRDMLDSLNINHSLITQMSNSNISLGEFVITGKAILSYEYFEDNKYLILEAEPCDPNILGVISDFSLETVGVDVCLAYYVSASEVKFSVRSCTKEVHADELAAHLADGYGGGGGHKYKAGGSMRPEKLDRPADVIFHNRIKSYFDEYDIIYAAKANISTDGLNLYQKLPTEVGCLKLSDVFPVGTNVSIRTLEGDINIRIDDDDHLMIGTMGEIYPINEDKLKRSYELISDNYEKEFEYTPKVKDLATGEKRLVTAYAKTVRSKDSSEIYAFPLKKKAKVFTAWDEENYYSGEIGDYLAIRADDISDLYVIKKDVFSKLYKEI
ncbi:DHH family phosphoesterase [Butyrivibrio sp. VCB2006]|uniref:DHH family phosphoesterase n=1 Tax=Butyrivibrio sp. VCB2006 TaxID=1280679 RepID=UPI000427FB2D|nr:DHH family phosphoesterase [Butyrivibrio sp. VCB2006]